MCAVGEREGIRNLPFLCTALGRFAVLALNSMQGLLITTQMHGVGDPKRAVEE